MRSVLHKWATRIYRYRAERTYGRNTFLFLFGSMRCGSSLLTHLLLNSRRMTGIGETWTIYREIEDIKRAMALTFSRNRQLRIRGQIVMDKVLHNHLIENEAILREPHIKAIFLLRPPEPSIRSMVRGKGRFYGLESVEEIADYYASRVLTLVRYAAVIGDPARAPCSTYQDLVHDTTTTLDGIRHFLALEHELEPRYRNHWFTGVPGLGDFTAKIHSGEIDRTPSADEEVRIPEHLLARCTGAYEHALEELTNRTTRTGRRRMPAAADPGR